MEDFNFLTVLRTGGEYAEKHVEWLQRQVKIPILCLTDSKQLMKNVTSIPLKYNWPSWWCKMEMFRPDVLERKNILYADLDTVFLDGIPEHYKTLDKTVVLADISKPRPDRPPKPIMNSGLMFLTGYEDRNIWGHFKPNAQDVMPKFVGAGDQGYIDTFLRPAARWQTLYPDEIKSYKTHIQGNGLSGKERVIVFHGQPRPWDPKLSYNKWIPTLL
jgi:hypothetical protein